MELSSLSMGDASTRPSTRFKGIHSKGIRKSNSNSKNKSNNNSKSNSTQQQHQQQQQQKLSKTSKQPVWQAAGLAGLLFEYVQIFLSIFNIF